MVGTSSIPFGEQLREQRRLDGLCFQCGISTIPDINARGKFVAGRDKQDEQEEAEEEDYEGIGEEDNGEISIHALKGVANNKIIKVEGQVKGCNLMILIDSGSTHSFLDESTTKRLKCQLIGTPPLSVTVANGQRALSKSA